MIEMLNCDCMDYMAGLPDKAFELAIVDPPYGIGIGETINSVTGGIKYTPKNWDDEAPPQEYFLELRRVSRNQVVWGANHFIDRMPLSSPCWVVWDKNNGASLFSDAELAWTSFNSPVRLTKIHWCGSAAIHETGQNKIHPTQKPIALYKWLLKNYAKPNDKIFDSHVGSGSIRIACHDMGFDFEGCEIDKDYWEAQEERYNTHISQQDLFSGEAMQKAIYQEAFL